MKMEISPLNKAHQQERMAEALLQQNKFDECIECHKQAIELLSETCKMTDNVRALESLNLQKEYHTEQIEIVTYKKGQHMFNKTVEEQRKKILSLSMEGKSKEKSLLTVFNKTFEAHDTLVDYLLRRNDSDSIELTSEVDSSPSETTQIVGNKRPKDDSEVIEELKILSSQLRGTVKCLLSELEERDEQIANLKDRIKTLEQEMESAAKSKGNSSLKVVTDSSGATSPYVFSPSSELSPDVMSETRAAPPLPTLEMPSLDFLNRIYASSGNSQNK